MTEIKSGCAVRVSQQEQYAEDCAACERQTYDDDVRDFHEKFKLPVTGTAPPHLLTPEEFAFRRKFMQEELDEFCDAHADGDLAGALDALVDLAWVAIGTAHYMHLPFDDAWREVVRANMEKVLADSDPNKPYRTHFVVKPPGWTPPDIEGVIIRHLGKTTPADKPTHDDIKWANNVLTDSEGGEM